MKSKIDELLATIATKFPEIQATLPPGASEEQIKAITEATKLEVPESLKDLLRLTNVDEKWGESPHAFVSYFLHS